MTKKSKFFELLAVEVAGGLTIKAAANSVNCSINTAYHISSNPDFNQRVASIRSEAIAGAVGRLSIGAAQAVDTLVSLMGLANEPSVRLNAAKAILGQLGPLTELCELRERIDRLEGATLKVSACG